LSSGVFVGRSGEVTALRELVAAVAAGRGGVAWVEGEPGIGKSTLVEQGLAGAAELGCALFCGTADPLRARFPLAVLLDSLQVDARSTEGVRGEIAGLLRGEGVGALLPAGGAVTAAAERVLVLVDRLCAISPVIVVLDDLQWADEVSVSVWHRLAGAVGQVPLLLVAVSRPVPRSPGVAAARQDLAGRGTVILPVGPLPDPEVATLVASVAGGHPGPGLLARANQAGGNPLYLRELVDALVRDDRVTVSGGVADVAAGEPDAGPAPLSLAAAIEVRLGFLSDRALAVLRTAALLGPRFAVRELAAMSGLPVRELAEVIGEAVTTGVLVESGLDLVFRHGLIAQALAAGTPAGLRAELHRDAARTLADDGATAERVAAQLLSVAGEMDGWTAAWLADNAAALVHRTPQGAAELLTRTVAGLAPGHPHREQLTEHLARVLFLLGRYEQSEALARKVLAESGDPERRARTTWVLAYTLTLTGRRPQAIAFVDYALQDPSLPDLWRARLRSERALMLLSDGRYDEADAAAAQTLADAERAGDRFAIGYALHVQASARAVTGDTAAALRIAGRALDVIGDDPETADLRLLMLGNRLAALGNEDRDADAEARELLTLAEQVGTARSGSVRETVAQYEYEAGRWDDALADLNVVFESGSEGHNVVKDGHALAALIAAHRDDRAGLAAHLDAAQAPARAESKRQNPVSYLGQALAVAAEQDRCPGEAMVLIATAAHTAEAEGVAEDAWLADLVRYALAAGDGPTARDATRRCENAAREGGPRTVATAHWCRGLVDADPAALADAVAYYRTVSRPLKLGQALEDLAVAQAAGNADAARATLREAVQIYASLGAEWDTRRADARLRPFGVRRRRAGARRPETGWDALTPTEAKIAAMVGEGLSNPDIAARLFLSRNTVQVHMSKILAKLQAHSRLEVAVVVARRAEAARPVAARSTA
jgi:DNA-binding CsgD family transcriptional regulator/tetratricopeptide (TPR) repeat protein